MRAEEVVLRAEEVVLKWFGHIERMTIRIYMLEVERMKK